jgi:hypothetical protein
MAAKPARRLEVGVPALQRNVSMISPEPAGDRGPNEFLTNGTVRMRAHARSHRDPGGAEAQESKTGHLEYPAPTGCSEVCSLDCAVAWHALPP